MTKMNGIANTLAIEKLEGGNYNIDSIIKAIQTFSNWALRVGIALAGGIINYRICFICCCRCRSKTESKTKNNPNNVWYSWNNISNINS